MSTDSTSMLSALRTGIWYGYVVLVVIFLMIPIFSLVIASFYDGQIFSLPFEFTTKWYSRAVNFGSVVNAFQNTLKISIPVTILSTIFGTAAGIGYTRYNFRGQNYIKYLFLLPIFFPLLLIGLGMSMWTSFIGLGYGIIPAIIGETTWISPIVMFVVSVTALSLDPNLEDASKDLGASTLTTYRRITIPLISDGVIAGMIFAFVLSWNSFYIVSYLKGARTTIPTWIQGHLSYGFSPMTPAVASIIFYVSTVLVIAGLMIVYRGDWFVSKIT